MIDLDHLQKKFTEKEIKLIDKEKKMKANFEIEFKTFKESLVTQRQKIKNKINAALDTIKNGKDETIESISETNKIVDKILYTANNYDIKEFFTKYLKESSVNPKKYSDMINEIKRELTIFQNIGKHESSRRVLPTATEGSRTKIHSPEKSPSGNDSTKRSRFNRSNLSAGRNGRSTTSNLNNIGFEKSNLSEKYKLEEVIGHLRGSLEKINMQIKEKKTIIGMLNTTIEAKNMNIESLENKQNQLVKANTSLADHIAKQNRILADSAMMFKNPSTMFQTNRNGTNKFNKTDRIEILHNEVQEENKDIELALINLLKKNNILIKDDKPTAYELIQKIDLHLRNFTKKEVKSKSENKNHETQEIAKKNAQISKLNKELEAKIESLQTELK